MTADAISSPKFARNEFATPSRETRLALHRSMLKIRRTEERIRTLYPEGDMRCPTHLSIGQEAVAAGVCANLRRHDYVISAHRSHAHYIAKGGNLRAMFAELYGKVDGCASGKGGSMHLIDLSVNFLGCVPIVGSTIPIGVGAAFGATLQGSDAISVVFFGDAAVETGVFHESLNFAATQQLPVLFACENNLYSVNTPLDVRQPANRTIADLARGHGILSVQCDGQAVEEIHALTQDVIAEMRKNGGPALIEFMTYRWAEHCGPLDDIRLGYRTQKELGDWIKRCPIKLHEDLLQVSGVLEARSLGGMETEIGAEIDDALTFAKASPFPARHGLTENLFSA